MRIDHLGQSDPDNQFPCQCWSNLGNLCDINQWSEQNHSKFDRRNEQNKQTAPFTGKTHKTRYLSINWILIMGYVRTGENISELRMNIIVSNKLTWLIEFQSNIKVGMIYLWCLSYLGLHKGRHTINANFTSIQFIHNPWKRTLYSGIICD